MRLRQRAGHVHVVRIGLEGAREDRHHELRIDRVHHEVHLVRARELGDGCGVARIDLRRWKLRGAAEGVGEGPGS